jgi:hypothetical protein
VPMTFHEREQGFEAKFAHDEELRFRVAARRDKLFARWVATTLRLSSEMSETLVQSVLAIPSGPTHDQAVLEYVTAFASGRGIGGLGGGLAEALNRCAQRAFAQLVEAPP